MAFEALTTTEIQVGKSIKKELFRKIKASLDDLNSRLNTVSAGSNKIEVFNLDILNASVSSSMTGLIYHEALQNFRITQVQIQVFDTLPTSGVLSVDVKKNTTPDNVGMTSILTTQPSINFTTATNYQKSTGVLDSGLQQVLAGEIIRLDITNIPTNLAKFRVIVYGEV